MQLVIFHFKRISKTSKKTRQIVDLSVNLVFLFSNSNFEKNMLLFADGLSSYFYSWFRSTSGHGR